MNVDEANHVVAIHSCIACTRCAVHRMWQSSGPVLRGRVTPSPLSEILC